MTTVLRIIQGVLFLSIGPMFLLGLMSSLSGGGVTPAFQEIGGQMMTLSLVLGILGLASSEAIHRWLKLTPLAILLALAPFGVWIWLVVRLEQETGFFGG